jgi:hypothetical protein
MSPEERYEQLLTEGFSPPDARRMAGLGKQFAGPARRGDNDKVAPRLGGGGNGSKPFDTEEFERRFKSEQRTARELEREEIARRFEEGADDTLELARDGLAYDAVRWATRWKTWPEDGDWRTAYDAARNALATGRYIGRYDLAKIAIRGAKKDGAE